MKSLTCHCCGASNAPNPSVHFVECDYCHAKISVVAFFKSVSFDNFDNCEDLNQDENNTISRLVKSSLVYLDANDYKSARSALLQVLNIYPDHISSRLNLAKTFLIDIEINPIERCRQVLRYCDGINKCNHDFYSDALLQSIAFDIASLATSLVNSFDAFELFDISMKCYPSTTDRDIIISGYVDALIEKFALKFEDSLRVNKTRHSPNVTDVNLLCLSSIYSIKAKSLCLTLIHWIENNTKSIHPRVLDKVSDLKAAADGYNKDYAIYKFGVFGSLKKCIINSL